MHIDVHVKTPNTHLQRERGGEKEEYEKRKRQLGKKCRSAVRGKGQGGGWRSLPKIKINTNLCLILSVHHASTHIFQLSKP